MAEEKTSSDTARQVRVTVCVATYMRPEGLTQLLRGLGQLVFGSDRPNLDVVVVDNDGTGSARSVCDHVRAEVDFPIRYYIEPRRGIPQARNKSIACACAGADFLVFIDDDEVPDPSWLGELLRIQREHDADVVTGPVLPYFTAEPPAWVIKGSFYESRRATTGQHLHKAFTGNMLCRREVFEVLSTHFDERLALSGGEDSHFSRRLCQAGFTIVWAQEAVIHEWIPPTRVTIGWILRRAYRTGNTVSFCDMDIQPSLGAAAGAIAKGAFWIARGVVGLPFAPLIGRHAVVNQLRWICYGAGRLAGLVGIRYREYGATHGT